MPPGPHLGVGGGLLRQQPRALQVLDLVLPLDLVVALAAGAAGGVVTHAVVAPLALHRRHVGRCRGVKDHSATVREPTA